MGISIFWGSLAGVPILGGGLPWPFMGITGGLMCGSMPHWPCLLVYKKEFRKELQYVAEAMHEIPIWRWRHLPLAGENDKDNGEVPS